MQWRAILRLPIIRVASLACARRLDAPFEEVSPPQGVTIRVATTGDAPRLAAAMAGSEFRGSRLGVDDVARRFASGDGCLIAEAGEQVAYLSWIKFTDASMRRNGVEVPLRPDEAYIDAVFAMPSYRGQGLATAVAAARLTYLRDRGVKVAFGWVAPHNTPIIRVLQRAGYRIVGSISQLIWQVGSRTPMLNVVVAIDSAGADPSLQLCTPERVRCRTGLVIYRRRPA